MKFRKKLLSLILTLTLVLGLSVPGMVSASEGQADLSKLSGKTIILHTDDLHVSSLYYTCFLFYFCFQEVFEV